MRPGFELGVDQLAVFLEHVAQRSGGAGAGLAVALGDFLFQLGQRGLHGLVAPRRALPDRPSGAAGLAGAAASAGTPRADAQFVGPHRHRRQRRGGIGGGGHGLRQRALERVPHHLQLRLARRRAAAGTWRRRWPSWRRPAALRPAAASAATSARSASSARLRVAPGLGGQHLDALRQQHGGLALHLHAVLQVLDALDALGQLRLEAGQRLARQRRAGLGGVALPGHARRRCSACGCASSASAFCAHSAAMASWPLARLISSSFSRSGARGALVAAAQLLEDLLHLLGRRVAGQPVAHALRRARRKSARRRRRRSACRGHWRSWGLEEA